jgi:NADH-quinone oxidoreductase subunit L
MNLILNLFLLSIALILFLPLAGYLGIIFFGKYLSKPSGGILASILVSISFLLGIFVSLLVHKFGQVQIELFKWIETAGLHSNFSLQIDALSSVMLLVITGVGALIHIYSIGYMHDDEHFNSFFAHMNLFIFFMLLLVLSDNYLLLFAGWEGVGLCSYLLIGFWYKNPEFAKAANKAFIMNRIGDLGLMLGIAMLFYTFHSIGFQDIQTALGSGSFSTGRITLIAGLLLIGAVGKSAQIPLFTWLPDAMAGPTPVSALIHAATMVTAGVYLIIRSHMIYSLSPIIMEIIIVLGIFTSLMAATIALMQNDIKKILAYSTISQLGLMFFALGLGAYSAALFHLVTHAFFKALLFLGAGSVIHALNGEQDIRQMGGLKEKILITYLVMLIGTIAISGIPPFSGFFSKDSILSAALEKSTFIWILGIVVSLMTVFYMFRLLFAVFYGNYRGTGNIWSKIHESPAIMTIPLLILSFLSIVGGVLNLPHIFGGNEWLSKYLGITTSEKGISSVLEWSAIIGTLVLIGFVLFYAYNLFLKKSKVPVSDIDLQGIQKILSKKFYIDEIYDFSISKPLNFLSVLFYNIVELKFLDGIVEGVGQTFKTGSRVLRYVQSGSVNIYLMLMVLGIILVLVFNIII